MTISCNSVIAEGFAPSVICANAGVNIEYETHKGSFSSIAFRST